MGAHLNQKPIRERWRQYWLGLPRNGQKRKAVADAIGISESLCRRFLNEDIGEANARRIALFLENPSTFPVGLPDFVFDDAANYSSAAVSISLSMLPPIDDLVEQMDMAHRRNDVEREERARQLILRAKAAKRCAHELQTEINAIVDEYGVLMDELKE